MKSCVILYLILLLSVSNSAFEYSCNGKSFLNKPVERIFSRRKRGLLLPTGSTIKITIAIGKAIISTRPKGLNLSIELSTYYPIPTTVDDWYTKKSKTKTTPRPKPENVFINIPGTNIRFPAETVSKRPPVPYTPTYKPFQRKNDNKVSFFLIVYNIF